MTKIGSIALPGSCTLGAFRGTFGHFGGSYAGVMCVSCAGLCVGVMCGGHVRNHVGDHVIIERAHMPAHATQQCRT